MWENVKVFVTCSMTFCATEVSRFSLLMVLRFTTWILTKTKTSYKNIHF